MNRTGDESHPKYPDHWKGSMCVVPTTLVRKRSANPLSGAEPSGTLSPSSCGIQGMSAPVQLEVIKPELTELLELLGLCG